MSRYSYEIEDCRILDIKVFKPNLKLGYGSGNYRWLSDGEVNSQVGYTIRTDQNTLRLVYTKTDYYTKEKTDFDFQIKLSSTKCNFNGLRYWMHCPLSKNGIKCNRRVSKLYLAPNCDYFGCRNCLNLTYHSKTTNYRHPMFSSLHKIFSISDFSETVKRKYYAGKPTKRMRKLIEMKRKYYPLLNDITSKVGYNS